MLFMQENIMGFPKVGVILGLGENVINFEKVLIFLFKSEYKHGG